MKGIVLRGVNICVDNTDESHAFIMFDVSDNGLDEEVSLLAVKVTWDNVGKVLKRLLEFLHVPSMEHARGIPVLIDLNGHDWKLVAFRDTNMVFSPENEVWS